MCGLVKMGTWKRRRIILGVTWLNKVGREMEMFGEFRRGEPWVKTHSKETQRASDVKNYHKK
jgi:hypothetical protein